MILVIDASVAIKWFLFARQDEQNTDLALGVLERAVLGSVELLVPPHFIAEVAAVLARLKPDDAESDLLDLLDIPMRTIASPEIYATALRLSLRYEHHIFDTLYHAVALDRDDAQVITADARYYKKAKTEGQITLLENLSLA